jgi:hypothetical protein
MSSTSAAAPTVNPSLAHQADLYLDTHHESFVRLGDRLFDEFRPSGGQISSQVRSLQQVATSATRFVDVEDFVKNQMGRGRASSKAWLNIGEETLAQLDSLRTVQAGLPSGPRGQAAPPEMQLQFRLRLVRGWVRAVVSQYLYRAATQDLEQDRG